MPEKIIALACSAGMSTSLLVTKMKAAAKERGKDYEIYAKPVSEIDNMLLGIEANQPDVLLLGPQVSYMKNEVVKKGKDAGIPVDVIEMQAYGMMWGDKILLAAEKLMQG